MSERDEIHQYLKSFSRYLSRLSKEDANEVIKEIESHILDVIEHKENAGEQIDAKAILAGFGSPRQLAEQYVDHMIEGTPPPAGFKAIQSVKKGITRGAYWGMFIFGMGVSVLLLIVGVAKLFLPDQIGVWLASHGNSVILSFAAETQPNSQEVLGFWLAPIVLILGLVLGKLTRSVLAVLKQHL